MADHLDIFGIGIAKAGASRFANGVAPLSSRLTHEIPKPKDWQAFQRNCVILFRAELNDHHVQEYGRHGQKQGGVDIIGRRDGDHNCHVGIQCRLITTPLKQQKILSDCRAALELNADLKEIIFATTAPDDTNASDATRDVERQLRSEGHLVTVALYGWGQLQILIARHEEAYTAFCPSAIATAVPQPVVFEGPELTDISGKLDLLMAALRVTHPAISTPLESREPLAEDDEDPVLHARIDAYRDLIRDGEPGLAEKPLKGLLEGLDPQAKPWAYFRIITNLASIAFACGREADAAHLYEVAHAARSTDSKAMANLALARVFQSRFDEAMELAQAALSAESRADYAVGYLLQAAARSNWRGDPEALIPADLAGSEDADLGLAEFLRFRDVPQWATRALELSRNHPYSQAFKRVRALAILSLAAGGGGYIRFGPIPVAPQEIDQAATDMKAVADRYIRIDYVNRNESFAWINNAAVLLRLACRTTEAEDLLARGVKAIGPLGQLVCLLATIQAQLERPGDALTTLKLAPEDAQAQLLSVELVAQRDPQAALDLTLCLDDALLDPHSRQVRWMITADLAIDLGDRAALDRAITALRNLGAPEVRLEILGIKAKQRGSDCADDTKALQQVVAALPDNLDLLTRFFVAEELRDHGLPLEATRLLDGHVDLDRPNPAARLYLQMLAAARRDEAFRSALAQSGDAVRTDPEILWATAAHAWNIGDLRGSLSAVNTLLTVKPDSRQARLLKIELLLRGNQGDAVREELAQPVETLSGGDLEDQFRIASILAHFGLVERAAALAYRLFLCHRDQARAWMTFSMLVLEAGHQHQGFESWQINTAGLNTAVDLDFDDGGCAFFVVEPDPELRKVDGDALEPDHPLVVAVMGKSAEEPIATIDGRNGVIRQVRHKYVARTHYAMEHYERRFPTIFGFQRINLDPSAPGGLDEMIAKLKQRSDWIREETGQYAAGPMPLAILAHRLGVDVIDAASAVHGQGLPVKVVRGHHAERDAAARAIKENGRSGCVLDLGAFWTAWRLKALGTVANVAGPIALSQRTLDTLRLRREKSRRFAENDGLHTAAYDRGKVALHEVAVEVLDAWTTDLDEAIAWAEANSEIRPLAAGDDLPDEFLRFLQSDRPNVFDEVIISHNTGRLLISDDVAIREIAAGVGVRNAAWLHAIFTSAEQKRVIDVATFVQWTAALMDAGQSFHGVSSTTLAKALELDVAANESIPGWHLKRVGGAIGGSPADPPSHIAVVIGFINLIWTNPQFSSVREPATGYILEQLAHGRANDCGAILRSLLAQYNRQSRISAYLLAWIRGHFMIRLLQST